MRNKDVVTTTCPCGSKIAHHQAESPVRCVSCKKKFINADDVVIIKGKKPPTIVEVDPVGAKTEVNK